MSCAPSILGLIALSMCVSPHMHPWRSWGQGGQSLLAYASTPELRMWQYWVTICVMGERIHSIHQCRPDTTRQGMLKISITKSLIHYVPVTRDLSLTSSTHCWPKLSREMTTRYRCTSQISEANLREGASTAEFLLNLDKREYQGEWGRP